MRRQTDYSNRREEFKTNYYVDGNTVRRLEGEPEERRQREIEKENEQRQKRLRNAAKRNQERAMHINLGYVAFCTAVVCLLGIVCVCYIRLQSDITRRTKHISSLESQITKLCAENDAEKKRIDLSVDLDVVKKRAQELGMKFASPEQIIYYTIEDSDFMDQYSDIPEN